MMLRLSWLDWLFHYRANWLPGDTIAGLTVATMLIPQSMAYALLAGLPAEMGLYASILPVIIYGLLGSSRVLTFGPTAITSVLVLASIEQIAPQGTALYITYGLTLALVLGVVFILMAIFRLGFLANLLSQPVLMGYVHAAALIILFSQISNLLGLETEGRSRAYELLWENLRNLNSLNWITLIFSGVGLVILFYFKYILERHLRRFRLSPALLTSLTRTGPLAVVVWGIGGVYFLGLQDHLQIVGKIPRGLPPLNFDRYEFSHLDTVLLGAIAIAFVGFMEALSTAQSLIPLREQTIKPNQELWAMGLANIGSALTSGIPVTTSISRSAVNHATGAHTGLSSLVAALVIIVVVSFLTPIFYYLPNAVLATIIVVSVLNLFDIRSVRQLWRYDRLETLAFAVTFGVVLTIGIAEGILTGVITTIGLHFWRSARPQIIELGRIEYSEYYRSVMAFETTSIAGVIIIRIDESLYFANVRYLELQLREIIARQPEVYYVVLACGAVNRIDASAMQALNALIDEFNDASIQIYIAEMKEELLRRLKRVRFIETVGEERFFATIHTAVNTTGRLIDDQLPI
jgi:SulP family sulfate permease